MSLGNLESVQINRVFIYEKCSVREVILYVEVTEREKRRHGMGGVWFEVGLDGALADEVEPVQDK